MMFSSFGIGFSQFIGHLWTNFKVIWYLNIVFNSGYMYGRNYKETSRIFLKTRHFILKKRQPITYQILSQGCFTVLVSIFSSFVDPFQNHLKWKIVIIWVEGMLKKLPGNVLNRFNNITNIYDIKSFFVSLFMHIYTYSFIFK